MSLRSMTGFGRGEAASHGVKISAELSSINRRQLDVHLTLPKGLEILESRAYDVIHHALTRGRITGEVTASSSSRRLKRSIHVDEPLAGAYLTAMRRASQRLRLRDDFSGSLLLSLPNVVTFRDVDGDADALWPVVQTALQRAVQRLLASKLREGRALERDIGSRLRLLEKGLAAIRKRAPFVARSYREALLQRIREAGVDLRDAEERLLREVALFADRSDVTEEITRLASHLVETGKLLRTRPPMGKTLDFLAQEMFREINTVGSKANDAALLQQVVGFKAELERIREQLQNIE